MNFKKYWAFRLRTSQRGNEALIVKNFPKKVYPDSGVGFDHRSIVVSDHAWSLGVPDWRTRVHAKISRHFVFWQSARGLAHSMKLRAVRQSPANASRLGLRRPSAAFPGGISNCANVNWNCYTNGQKGKIGRFYRCEMRQIMAITAIFYRYATPPVLGKHWRVTTSLGA